MSHPDYKADPALGQKVKDYLMSVGLETPMTVRVNANTENKIIAIEAHMLSHMMDMGLGPEHKTQGAGPPRSQHS